MSLPRTRVPRLIHPVEANAIRYGATMHLLKDRQRRASVLDFGAVLRPFVGPPRYGLCVTDFPGSACLLLGCTTNIPVNASGRKGPNSIGKIGAAEVLRLRATSACFMG